MIHGLAPSERTATRPAFAAHLASLAVAGALLLYLARGFWFHYDEWDIVGNHALGLFEPHNEHWSTLPYLVYRALYPVFGLRQYLPYLAVVVALHLGVAHLAWRVMRRQGVGDWLATGAAAAFLVLGAGAENLVWAWQMGFVGSVFFGYLAMILTAAGRESPARYGVAAAAAVAAVMCSGIGLVMVLVAAAATALSRGWRRALLLAGPAAVLFTAWYLTVGRHTGVRTYAAPTPGGSLAFLWTGLTATAEMGTGLPFLGPPLVLVALGWAAWRARRPAGSELALVCLLGAVVLFALISLGRIRYGADSARAGRYVYVAAALLLPVFAMALQRLASTGRLGTGAAVLLVLWAGVHGARVLVLAERQHGAVSAHTRQLVLAAAAGLDASGQGGDPRLIPDPVAAPTLTLGRIGGFKRDRALPPS